MRAIDAGILICTECHELNQQEPDADEQSCSRCGALIHARRPNSLTRTWALLITEAILYIPANLLPIMTINSLGQGDPSTIMSGVIQLVQHGMFPIAAVVFIASILVPTFKLVGIGLVHNARVQIALAARFVGGPRLREYSPCLPPHAFCRFAGRPPSTSAGVTVMLVFVPSVAWLV